MTSAARHLVRTSSPLFGELLVLCAFDFGQPWLMFKGIARWTGYESFRLDQFGLLHLLSSENQQSANSTVEI
jgi:hypothetical protein